MECSACRDEDNFLNSSFVGFVSPTQYRYSETMKIGIIGARLSGSYASLLLSRLGHEVLLFDDAAEKEKPCGGGVTTKALRTMPWLRQHPLPHAEVTTIRLSTSAGSTVDLKLRNPIFIFSRYALDSSLREAAVSAGTRFLPERAIKFARQGSGWAIVTGTSSHEVDFLVGADGALSAVRSLVNGKYRSADLSLALGFYIPGPRHSDTVVTVFQESGFQGYIWSFPRVDHLAVGILRRLPSANAGELRRRIQDFIKQHYPDAGPERRFYAALIPCLSRQNLVSQRVCGPNWALLGDAAGFTDAITAEGIYFALRSAELLVQAVKREDPASYEHAWRKDFGADLLMAAEWRDRFYGGTFLFQALTRRTIQMNSRSQTAQRLTDAVIAGQCTYRELSRRLILESPRILMESLVSRLKSDSLRSREQSA